MTTLAIFATKTVKPNKYEEICLGSPELLSVSELLSYRIEYSCKPSRSSAPKNTFMTHTELISILAERFPQFQSKDVETSAKEILGAIGNVLIRGDRVEVRGFGSLGLTYRPPRVARNPKTGETVKLSGKRVPHFKAGKSCGNGWLNRFLRSQLNWLHDPLIHPVVVNTPAELCLGICTHRRYNSRVIGE